MSFILHTESPSTEDIIDGNSHNNISIKIAETLMRDDVNIIGINGPLGSGKSTVIKLLEKNLPQNKFQFINFDAELYQQGSTKKALITKIYDGLKPKIPNSLRPKLREFKDNALGNNVTYKKTQDSEISIWAILFLFSLFICTQSIRPLQTEWSKTPENINYFLISIFLLFLVSPLLVSGIFVIRSFWDNSLKLGNIIKKTLWM
ncbi:P-loop NTPase fold protein [Buttiauxella agrestis]